MRDVILMLICLLIGVAIGYYFESMLKPYFNPYSFQTTLTLTAKTNSTIVSIGETVFFSANLSASIPSELNFEQFKQIVYKDKLISLLMRETNATYWKIVETGKTFYMSNYGSVSFSFTFSEAGNYEFKALFEGDNLLKRCESQIISVTVY